MTEVDLRISWAVSAADVLALGALLLSAGEESIALVAVAANTLGWLLKNEVLSSVASWLGNQWPGRAPLGGANGRDGTLSGSSSLLDSLRWRAGAVLASLVGALWADLLATKLRLALVASAVNTEANLLLNTLGSLAEVDGIDVSCVDASLLGVRNLVLIVLCLVLGLSSAGSLGAVVVISMRSSKT